MPDFPRYPGSGGRVERPPGEPPPRPVLTAVKLMYAGAAVSFAGLVIGLATAGGLKSAVRKAQPTMTAAQVNNSAKFIVAAAVISGLIGAALWLWMASANRHGKPWARILSSVFFAVSTLNTVADFAQAGEPLNRVLTALVWLVGLGAIILLWRPDASVYYRASSGQPG